MSAVDLSGNIDEFLTHTGTRRRYGSGTVVAGRVDRGEPEEASVGLVVVPISGQRAMQLGMGDRSSDLRTVYAAEGALRTARGDGVPADEIEFDDETWRVLDVRAWQAGAFIEAVVQRVGS